MEALPAGLSLRAQCALLGISRGRITTSRGPKARRTWPSCAGWTNLHLERPVFGSWRLAALLRREGWAVNRSGCNA
ncbi:MAG: hypothetical protein KIS67_16265 [Verrucomicrobiae bacterium]|nr:hypothetical protein [Verrucomicrobiae bacterium]